MIKLNRNKKRNLLLSAAYKLGKVLPFSATGKLKLFLDLQWIFGRLAHEQTFKTSVKISPDVMEDFLVSRINTNVSVLDIGCGEGYIIQKLLPKTTRIVGIDYNGHSIDVAKAKTQGTNVEVFCIDIFDYFKRHPEKHFDVMILSHVLEHIDNPSEFLKSLIGKAEYCYVEVPDFDATHLNAYRVAIGCDLVYTDADHVTEFERMSIEAMFRSMGISVVNSEFRHAVMKYWLKMPSR